MTLLDGKVTELVNAKSYGLESAAALDALVEAGFCVEVKREPYRSGAILAESAAQQAELLKNEVAYTLEAAARGVAPAVFAMFLVAPHADAPASPLQAAAQPPLQLPLDGLVSMRQVSTFTLATVMEAAERESEPARRARMESTLLEMCEATFGQVAKLCAVSNGFATVKLNMRPAAVAFCPSLLEDGDQWKLEGAGHLPVSQTHLDGKPFITDFHAAFTARARKDSYSPEVSLVMHSLIMLAFTKAVHGPAATRVMWKALLRDAAGSCRGAGDGLAVHQRVRLPGVHRALLRDPQVRRPEQGHRRGDRGHGPRGQVGPSHRKGGFRAAPGLCGFQQTRDSSYRYFARGHSRV